MDCFKLVKGTGKSIGIYNLAKNLIDNLVKQKKNARIIVLGNSYNREDFDIEGVEFAEVKYDPRSQAVCAMWELFLVNQAIRRIRPDKVLFPRGYVPLRNISENYVIIHDMIPFYYQKHFPGVLGKTNYYIMWRLKASARRAHRVITVSEYAKKDIVKIAKLKDPDKVIPILSGVNKMDVNVIRKGYYPEGEDREYPPYISAIASKLPHKNVVGVLKAYKAYTDLHSGKPVFDLHIIGLDQDGVDRTIAEQGIRFTPEQRERIIGYSYLPKDEDMYAVIKGSSVFLFLSLQEGFGFPPLEAMQLGVPVICSDRSSLPEVVGDAAILVDPENEKTVAEALTKMEDITERGEYIRRGYENIRKFQWEDRIQRYVKELLC